MTARAPRSARAPRAAASLAYKTWCETRVRFAVAVIALGAACALVVAQGDWRLGHPMPFARYVWSAAYNDSVKTAFIWLAIILGTGSLRQEHAVGTAGFTLALPVTRGQLLAVRAAVSFAEVAALAVFAAVVISGVSWATGGGALVGLSLRFVVAWTVCGGLLASIGLLTSIAIANEYVGWFVAILAIMAYQVAVALTPLRRIPACDLFQIMAMPSAGLPVFALLGVAAVASGVLAIGHRWLCAWER